MHCTKSWALSLLRLRGLSDDCIIAKVCFPRILMIYIAALIESSHVYHPDGFSNTLLSQSRFLANGSCCGNGRQNAHPKARGENEEPPIAQVWLLGQLVVMSS